MNSDLFRQIVDIEISAKEVWPDNVLEKLAILKESAKTDRIENILIQLDNCIQRSFSVGTTNISEECEIIVGEMIFDHVLLGLSPLPYCNILLKIKDAARQINLCANSIPGDWSSAVRYARFSDIEMSTISVETLTSIYSRYYAIAHAAAGLKQIGISTERNRNEIAMSIEMERQLVKVIERLASELGGMSLAWKLSKILEDRYDKKYERYHLINFNPDIKKPVYPAIPWGYLFQLAGRHFYSKENSALASNEKFNAILRFSQYYSTIIDIQDYSRFHHSPISPGKLSSTIQKRALSDSVFKISQIRCKDISRWLSLLIDASHFDLLTTGGWTIRNIVDVVHAVLIVAQNRGPARIQSRDIGRLCPLVPRDVVSAILKDVLCDQQENETYNQRNAVKLHENKEFQRMIDAGTDSIKFPMYRHTPESYVIIDKAVCSTLFIEAVFSQMRTVVENFDTTLGPRIEKAIRKILKEHNITTRSGKYKLDGKIWECDIVIETEKVIIFIEVKKKSLTRPSRRGSDVSLFLDLAQSLLEAQLQAGKHEIHLRRHTYLELDDQGEKYRLEIKDRKIERIALSLNEFGSFHNRLFIEKFFYAIGQVQLNTRNEEHREKFEKINRGILELNQQNELLTKSGDRRRPYFDCWFFSVYHLMVMLDGVDGAECFLEVLWETKGISSGHGDLYFEMSYAKSLKALDLPWYDAIQKFAEGEKTFMSTF